MGGGGAELSLRGGETELNAESGIVEILSTQIVHNAVGTIDLYCSRIDILRQLHL